MFLGSFEDVLDHSEFVNRKLKEFNLSKKVLHLRAIEML